MGKAFKARIDEGEERFLVRVDLKDGDREPEFFCVRDTWHENPMEDRGVYSSSPSRASYNETYTFARVATEDEVAQLRAELPMADIQDRQDAIESEVKELGVKVVALAESKCVCVGGPLPPRPGDWHLKSWGRTRQIFAAEGVEIWESEGKAGHRTSLHCHPTHHQDVVDVSGDLILHCENAEYHGGGEMYAKLPHELRFVTDCRFIEVYTGQGSVMDSIERIYR